MNYWLAYGFPTAILLIALIDRTQRRMAEPARGTAAWRQHEKGPGARRSRTSSRAKRRIMKMSAPADGSSWPKAVA
jgi:hypothetical protein